MIDKIFDWLNEKDEFDRLCTIMILAYPITMMIFYFTGSGWSRAIVMVIFGCLFIAHFIIGIIANLYELSDYLRYKKLKKSFKSDVDVILTQHQTSIDNIRHIDEIDSLNSQAEERLGVAEFDFKREVSKLTDTINNEK